MKFNLAKPYWFEQQPGSIVTMKDGTQYKVNQDGWRKVRNKWPRQRGKVAGAGAN